MGKFHAGSRFNTLREAQGFSLDGLMKASGVSKDTIHRAERSDEPVLRPSTLARLAAAFGLAPEDMIAWYRGDRETSGARQVRLVRFGVPEATDLMVPVGLLMPLGLRAEDGSGAMLIENYTTTMEPMIRRGDRLVAISAEPESLRSGDVVFLEISDEEGRRRFLGRWRPRGPNPLVEFENPEYEPLHLSDHSVKECAVVRSLHRTLAAPRQRMAPGV